MYKAMPKTYRDPILSLRVYGKLDNTLSIQTFRETAVFGPNELKTVSLTVKKNTKFVDLDVELTSGKKKCYTLNPSIFSGIIKRFKTESKTSQKVKYYEV